MGIYLNPGTMGFQTALNGEIWVDKTGMISELNRFVNTPQKYVSVSRPRRFGKSMAADMLCAYYEREPVAGSMFEDKKLAACKNWDRCLGKFDVIRLVMTQFIGKKRTAEESLLIMQRQLIDDLVDAYSEVKYYNIHDLTMVMNDIYRVKKTQFVIIIDEWDAIFREHQKDQDGQKAYLDFLRDWFKDQQFVALVYMTGILPIKKYGKHSALNMFTEFSMTEPQQMAPYTGFTEEEVRGLCRDFSMPFEDVKSWYDGYLLDGAVRVEDREQYRKGNYSDHRVSVYSPLSVVRAMQTGRIADYWNSTESFEALSEYIRMDYAGLRESVIALMDGARMKVDLSTYQNDMTTFYGRDDIFALLIHLGYLGYDTENGEVFIPNREILDEFRTSTRFPDWEPVLRAFQRSEKLLQATWEKDADRVARLLEEAHDSAENRTYNTETALSYAIQLAYYAAQKYYTTIQELDTGKGYADIVFLPSPRYPDKPALLVELKYGRTTQTALDQIRNRKYPQRLKHYEGNMLLVAVNYDLEKRSGDPNFKHHTCAIEEA